MPECRDVILLKPSGARGPRGAGNQIKLDAGKAVSLTPVQFKHWVVFMFRDSLVLSSLSKLSTSLYHLLSMRRCYAMPKAPLSLLPTPHVRLPHTFLYEVESKNQHYEEIKNRGSTLILLHRQSTLRQTRRF